MQHCGSCRDRVRRNVGIQSLPHERHSLRQAVTVERPRTDLRAECGHLLLKQLRSRPGLCIHTVEHVLVVEHVYQSPLSSDELGSGEKCTDSELSKDFVERWEIICDVLDAFLFGHRLVQRWRVKWQRR